MKGHPTLVFERNGERVEREPAKVFKALETGSATPKTLGRLVRVDAPRGVIGLVQQVPGEAVVEDSGAVASASMGAVLLLAAICIAFAAGFDVGYDAGYAAGSAASDEEGGGEDTDADSEQEDDGGGEGGSSQRIALAKR